MLTKMNIGTRLLTGFSMMLILTIGVSGFAIYQMTILADLTVKLHRHPFTVSMAIRDAHIYLLQMRIAMKNVALAENLSSIDAFVQSINDSEQEVYQQFETIKERFLGDSKDVDLMIQLFQEWKPIRDEIIELRKANERDKAIKEVNEGRGNQHFTKLEDAMNVVTEFAKNRAGQFISNATSVANTAYIWTIVFLAIAVIAGIVVALSIARTITRPLKTAVMVANQVAEGDLNVHVPITTRDEIGQMLETMQKMIGYIQQVAEVAERVSQNDLDAAVTPKSDRDVLNRSLQAMIANLKSSREKVQNTMTEIERQSWLKDGVNQLNSALLGVASFTDTCQKAVSFTARYVNAGKGVLYVYDEEQNVLNLAGTYAFTEKDRAAKIYRLGEGIIGQVALEKSPMLLKNLQRTDQVITTGTTSEPPVNTYTFPLMYGGNLYGVIELAAYEAFNAGKQAFLQEANQVIATVVFSALQRERVAALLRASENTTREAEEAKQDAQQQAEEARKTTVLLEEQQQQLLQQNEEFEQINAHLRSQQQRLQASESKLKDSDAKTRAIVDTAVDGILTIDDRGIVESFNPAAVQLFGYTPEEVIGHKVSMLMPSPHRENHDTYMTNFLTTGDAKIIGIGREVEARHKNGSVFPIRLAVSEMKLEGRRMFAGIIHDITELKQAQTALQELKAAFDSAQAAFDSAQADLERSRQEQAVTSTSV